MAGTSWWLDGRAGMAEKEVKAPAQQISKGMKGGCSCPAHRLAEATTSLSPETSPGPKTSSRARGHVPPALGWLGTKAWMF